MTGPIPVNDEAMVMAAEWGLVPQPGQAGPVDISCVARVGTEN